MAASAPDVCSLRWELLERRESSDVFSSFELVARKMEQQKASQPDIRENTLGTHTTHNYFPSHDPSLWPGRRWVSIDVSQTSCLVDAASPEMG